MKYIALLRSINVSGKNLLKMADLKESLALLNFKNITTYLQSGNIIFEYEPIAPQTLVVKIESYIRETFNLSLTIIVYTVEEFEKIVNNNPFLDETNVELNKLHVTLLQEHPDPQILTTLDLKKDQTERYMINKKVVYLYLPNGYGNTKLTNAVFEQKLKTKATTRNWNTMIKILELIKM